MVCLKCDVTVRLCLGCLGRVDPIMIAAIVVMESSGVADLRKFREDYQETACGLGQVTDH